MNLDIRNFHSTSKLPGNRHNRKFGWGAQGASPSILNRGVLVVLTSLQSQARLAFAEESGLFDDDEGAKKVHLPSRQKAGKGELSRVRIGPAIPFSSLFWATGKRFFCFNWCLFCWSANLMFHDREKGTEGRTDDHTKKSA